MKIKTTTPEKTQKLAAKIANSLTKAPLLGGASVLALEGELGAGKTTFVKGFARALGVKSKILSPTFVIIKSYGVGKNKNYKTLFHIDAYRLTGYRDLISLGIGEIVSNPLNVVLIEWSDRVKKILPKKYIKIHIDHIGQNIRRVMISRQTLTVDTPYPRF